MTNGCFGAFSTAARILFDIGGPLNRRWGEIDSGAPLAGAPLPASRRAAYAGAIFSRLIACVCERE